MHGTRRRAGSTIPLGAVHPVSRLSSIPSAGRSSCMDRRSFVSRAGLAAGALWLPTGLAAGRRGPAEDRKALADAALAAAREGGASYADVRISRYLTQTLRGRSGRSSPCRATSPTAPASASSCRARGVSPPLRVTTDGLGARGARRGGGGPRQRGVAGRARAAGAQPRVRRGDVAGTDAAVAPSRCRCRRRSTSS